MARNSAPLGQDDPTIRDIFQSIILDLVATWPVQTVGNNIWQIYRRLVKWLDALVRFGTRPTTFEQAALSKIYLLAESVGSEQFFQPSQTGSAALAMPLPHHLTPWQFQYVPPNSASERPADDIFIDIDLPPQPADQAVITDIAIPILLPDLLDSPDITPAQYLRDNFQVIIDADTLDQTTTLSLVDHNGQVLFSTASEPPSELPETIGKNTPRLPDH